ncbi:hypothetical protein D6777_03910 [Candidatus Woesearchaeota archaeon]|nr:MAG: hypothetical protein D6777_03910 [Candidatus Woesearchaeota archaeon]
MNKKEYLDKFVKAMEEKYDVGEKNAENLRSIVYGMLELDDERFVTMLDNVEESYKRAEMNKHNIERAKQSVKNIADDYNTLVGYLRQLVDANSALNREVLNYGKKIIKN